MIEFLAPAAAGLAILLGGLIKGAIGLGAPLVAVPVLAAIYGVKTAIAVMTVPLIVSNIWQIWTYRATIEGRSMLVRLLVGCIAGVVAGTFLLGLLPEAWLGLFLAIMLFVYLGLALSRPGGSLTQPMAEWMALPDRPRHRHVAGRRRPLDPGRRHLHPCAAARTRSAGLCRLGHVLHAVGDADRGAFLASTS